MKKNSLKFKSCGYLTFIILFCIVFATVGCVNSNVRWNEQTKRYESVPSNGVQAGVIKEINVNPSSTASQQSGLAEASTTQSGGAILAVENVTIPALQETPPPLDYIVGPGDIIMVEVLGAPEFSSVMSTGTAYRGSRVDGNGFIQMATLGLIKVGGMTLVQIREHIQKLLKEFIKEPSVIVEITEYKSYPIYILGQFKNTGIFYMDRPFNVMQGLALGGGYDSSANPRAARIIREKRVLPVDVYELLMNADQTQNVWLKPGDTIFMPDKKNQHVVVFGQGKPGISIPLPNTGMNILQAVGIAGLQKVAFHGQQVHLIRSLSPTRGQLMIVDIDAILSGDAMPINLCDGDVIYIPKAGITSWNEAISEILPSLQAFGAILSPFVQLKYLFD
jgi:polysaccharide export outer membrane protein